MQFKVDAGVDVTVIPSNKFVEHTMLKTPDKALLGNGQAIKNYHYWTLHSNYPLDRQLNPAGRVRCGRSPGCTARMTSHSGDKCSRIPRASFSECQDIWDARQVLTTLHWTLTDEDSVQDWHKTS